MLRMLQKIRRCKKDKRIEGTIKKRLKKRSHQSKRRHLKNKEKEKTNKKTEFHSFQKKSILFFHYNFSPLYLEAFSLPFFL